MAAKTFKMKKKSFIVGLYKTVMFLNLVFGVMWVLVHCWFEEKIRIFFHIM